MPLCAGFWIARCAPRGPRPSKRLPRGEMQPAFPVQNIYRTSFSDMEMPGGPEAGTRAIGVLVSAPKDHRPWGGKPRSLRHDGKAPAPLLSHYWQGAPSFGMGAQGLAGSEQDANRERCPARARSGAGAGACRWRFDSEAPAEWQKMTFLCSEGRRNASKAHKTTIDKLAEQALLLRLRWQTRRRPGSYPPNDQETSFSAIPRPLQ